MDKVRGVLVLALLVLVFISFSSVSVTKGDEYDEEQSKKTALSLWLRLRSAYSVYRALFPTSVGQYWHLAKALLNQAYVHLFPPNIERGDEGQGVTDSGGAGEKVKEALAKSIGTSKATMEGAAKSAADIAGETIEKAKQKVMNRETTPQKEL